MNPRNYDATTAIGGRKIVKPGATAKLVALATANTDKLIGVSGPLGGEASGPVDVHHSGLAEIILGGTVAFGDYITADSASKGVKLTDTMLQSGAINSVGIALSAGVSGDIIPILVIPQRVSKFDAVDSSAAEINSLNGAPLDASFVIGTEAANVINVGIQLKDLDGVDLAVRGSVKAYLSDDANGDSIVGTAPDGGVAIGTDGLAIPLVANKAFMLTSESDGDIDLNITHAAGAKTVYLILALPNGKLKASGAITFA